MPKLPQQEDKADKQNYEYTECEQAPIGPI
jgi:hypothetical protein